MKTLSLILSAILPLIVSAETVDRNLWSNTVDRPQIAPLFRIIADADINGSHGPDYTLISRHVIRSLGSLSRPGPILSPKEWISELKKGLKPSGLVTEFHHAKNSDDLRNFLSEKNLAPEFLDNLIPAVQAFLDGRPLPTEGDNGNFEGAMNPTILIGSVRKETVLLFASSDGKVQNATLLKIVSN